MNNRQRLIGRLITFIDTGRIESCDYCGTNLLSNAKGVGIGIDPHSIRFVVACEECAAIYKIVAAATVEDEVVAEALIRSRLARAKEQPFPRKGENILRAILTGAQPFRPGFKFKDERHQTIYRRISDLHDRDEHIDAVTVANQLLIHNELEFCGGLTYLVDLASEEKRDAVSPGRKP